MGPFNSQTGMCALLEKQEPKKDCLLAWSPSISPLPGNDVCSPISKVLLSGK